MDSIKFKVEEEIPVVAEADVVVVGGGPGGLGAAIMAARYGANVILVERYGMLGGMATYGEITPFMWNHFKASEDQAFPEAMDRPV
ncbi:MAG: FAD-dependent oxidoreductase, partial [Lentisphaeria bacterium]|nr:FAD-dependent oxidoreductase [Lentisphaeria bacterium]